VAGTGADLRETLLAAFESADRAMLRLKTRPRQRQRRSPHASFRPPFPADQKLRRTI
jgi:hypothetical protein